MNSKTLVIAIAAACMGLSGLAVAQDKEERAERAAREEKMRPPAPDRARDQRPQRDLRDQRDQRDHRVQYDQHDRRGPPPHMDRGRGAGPDYNFYRGGRLPPQYRGREYVVDDWRGHHLRQPPRGYHWVQTGPDYLLVAISTGIIASILLNQ
ncbi:MAG: RcnB family protein [Burkholderiales bacterium]